MSSAANHKREPLEEAFRHRMHDAEATPSADLWTRIDHDLTVQENGVYKKRMVLYRQLAAACFVLFVLAGALVMYHINTDAQQRILATVPQQQAASAPALAAADEGVTTPEAPAATAPVAEEALAAPQPDMRPRVSRTKTLEQPRQQTSRYVAVASEQPAAAAQALPAAHAAPGLFRAALQDTPLRPDREVMPHSSRFASNTSGMLQTPATTRTAFASLEPFYQATRQAVAASGFSHINSSLAAQQLLRNPAAFSQTGRQAVQGLQAALATEEDKLPRQQQEALVLALNGGDKKEKSDGSASRWTVGMAYAPSYFDQNIGIPEQTMNMASMRSFSAGGPSVNALAPREMEKAREEFADNTDPGFSYAFDAKVGMKLSRRLKLLTGIGYSQNTARTKSSYIIRQFLNQPTANEKVALDPSTVFVPALTNSLTSDSVSVAKTDDFTVNYRYRHLTLPVGLQYEGRLSKDWYWYAASGVAANFLLQTTVMASNNEVSDVTFDRGDKSPFRKVQLSGNVSMGVGKRLSNAVSVTVGPEFRGYFDTMLAAPESALAPQGKPYTVGLNMAVNYDLGSGRK